MYHSPFQNSFNKLQATLVVSKPNNFYLFFSVFHKFFCQSDKKIAIIIFHNVNSTIFANSLVNFHKKN
jgi:hypothetical protein